jgi:hypothetical protein
VTQPSHPRWTVFAEERPIDVFQQILKTDEQLYRRLMLFLRSAALEAGIAIDAGRRPPGMAMTDGRIALDVPRESVLIYYEPDPAVREIVVTAVVWAG